MGAWGPRCALPWMKREVSQGALAKRGARQDAPRRLNCTCTSMSPGSAVKKARRSPRERVVGEVERVEGRALREARGEGAPSWLLLRMSLESSVWLGLSFVASRCLLQRLSTTTRPRSPLLSYSATGPGSTASPAPRGAPLQRVLREVQLLDSREAADPGGKSPVIPQRVRSSSVRR